MTKTNKDNEREKVKKDSASMLFVHLYIYDDSWF